MPLADVLYAYADGVYASLPVDIWDEVRDARLHPGPLQRRPVIAHPPCNRWSIMAENTTQKRWGHRVGDDGNCFFHALESLKACGGVLEHPAQTRAWPAFGLAKPARGSWQRHTHDDGWAYWVTNVSQSAYGHPARKRTWLCYVGGAAPFDLDWREPPTSAVVGKNAPGKKRIQGAEASATPLAFAYCLLLLAVHSRKKARKR